MEDVERQLLSYLADQPRGQALVCNPSLVAALREICFRTPALVSDVYEGSDGSMVARITEAGRAALADEQTAAKETK